jgi:hypothetical protein
MKEVLLQIALSPAFQQLALTLGIGIGSFVLAKKLSEPYRKTLYMLLCIIEEWDKTVDIIPKAGKGITEERLVRIKQAVSKTLTAEQKKIVDNFLAQKGWLGDDGVRREGNWDNAPPVN